MRKTQAFLLASSGLLVGMLLANLWIPSLILLAASTGFLLTILLLTWRHALPKRVLLFALFGIFGLLYTSRWQTNQTWPIPFDQPVSTEAEVLSCRPLFSNARCVLLSIDPFRARLAATIPGEFIPGDHLAVTGRIRTLNSEELYLKGDGVIGIVEGPEVESRMAHPRSWRTVLFRSKTALESKLATVLTDPAASLASGLLFGSRQQFSADFRDDLARTNTMHIIAVSGFNITILVEFVRRLLGSFSRKTVFFITTGIISVFVLMIGAPASAVRAGIMGVALLLGKVLGRRVYIPSLILLTALLMALPNPFLLRYDLGFQLSFLAFVGLVALAPSIERRLTFLPPSLRGIAGATIGATIMTSPLIIPLRGEVSLIGPFVNLLILPLIPLLMLLAGLVLGVSFLSIAAAKLVGFLAYLPSLFVVSAIEYAADVPFASVPWFWSIMLLPLFLAVLTLMRKRHVGAH